MNKLVGIVTSRRGWVTAAAIAVAFVHGLLGLDGSDTLAIVIASSAWVVGDSIRASS